MNSWLKIVAFLAFAGALTAAGTYAWVRYPTFFRYDLKLATGPVGSDGQKLIAAFNRELAAEHPLVRMVPVATDTLAPTARRWRPARSTLRCCEATTRRRRRGGRSSCFGGSA